MSGFEGLRSRNLIAQSLQEDLGLNPVLLIFDEPFRTLGCRVWVVFAFGFRAYDEKERRNRRKQPSVFCYIYIYIYLYDTIVEASMKKYHHQQPWLHKLLNCQYCNAHVLAVITELQIRHSQAPVAGAAVWCRCSSPPSQ